MSEVRERSGLFKFFYIILRVITFPIFAVLFVLKHPVWIFFILLIIGCWIVYYPMSKGVKFRDIESWYMERYQTFKIQTVTKALDSGIVEFVPEQFSSDVKRIEKEYKEEIEEAKISKGENYNKRVVRDKKIEDTKVNLKKRGGFKKKTDASEESSGDKGEDGKTTVLLEENGMKAGGLAGILKKEELAETKDDNTEVQPIEIKPEVLEVKPDEMVITPENQVSDDKPKEEAKTSEDEAEFDLF